MKKYSSKTNPAIENVKAYTRPALATCALAVASTLLRATEARSLREERETGARSDSSAHDECGGPLELVGDSRYHR